MNGGTIIRGRVLIIESDAGLAALYADAISTHCPDVRIDVCKPSDHTLIEDNAGGADVAICGCGSTAATRLDMLRQLTTLRACLRVVVLVRADMPEVTDQAMAAGASDALLRAPGYLDQMPLIVRRNIREARLAIVQGRRVDEMRHELAERHAEVVSLRARLSVLERSPIAAEEPALPVVYVTNPQKTVLRMVMGEEPVSMRQQHRPTKKAA